jgi:hypothetical protein
MSASQTRVDAVIGYFNAGMRSDTVSSDTASWVRDGLRAIEKGEKVTPERLKESDSRQVMILDPRRRV